MVGLELLEVLVSVAAVVALGLVDGAVVGVLGLVEWLGGSSHWSGSICRTVLLVGLQ